MAKPFFGYFFFKENLKLPKKNYKSEQRQMLLTVSQEEKAHLIMITTDNISVSEQNTFTVVL